MSPAGLPMLVLCLLMFLGAPVLAYRLWDRGGSNGWRNGARRTSLFIAAQVAAMLFGLVAVNDYGELVTSWAQLGPLLTQDTSVRHLVDRSQASGRVQIFGATPSPAPPATYASERHEWASPALSSALRNARWTGWSSPADRPAKGGVVSLTLTGPKTGLSTGVLVYLPPQYFAGVRHLPVVEVFAGFPGTPTGLLRVLHYPDIMLEELNRGLVQPMVLVLAQPSVTYPRDTECTDVPGGERVLTYWTADVPQVLTRELGLRSPHFGAIGNSTGGYCAVKLGLFAPSTFSAVAGLSAYFSAEPDATTGELFGGSRHYRDLQDLGWRLEHLPVPRLRVLLATSRNERGPDGYAVQQRFLHLVRAPMSAEEFVLRRGFGHTFGTWLLEIPTALSWLSQQLSGG